MGHRVIKVVTKILLVQDSKSSFNAKFYGETLVKEPSNRVLKKKYFLPFRVSGTLKPVEYAGKKPFFEILTFSCSKSLIFGHGQFTWTINNRTNTE